MEIVFGLLYLYGQSYVRSRNVRLNNVRQGRHQLSTDLNIQCLFYFTTVQENVEIDSEICSSQITIIIV